MDGVKACHAASQVGMLSAFSFGVGALIAEGMTALSGGSLYAAIVGGNLALWYAARAIGEKYQMTERNVKILQSGMMGLYTAAVLISFLALDLLSTGMAVGAAIIFTSARFIVCSHQGEEIMENALPNELRELLFFPASIYSSVAAFAGSGNTDGSGADAVTETEMATFGTSWSQPDSAT